MPLGIVLNFCIEELRPFDAPAFKVLDPGGKTHLDLGDHEREETVPASPFGGSEIARECRELVDKVSNRVEGGLSHDCVKWDYFHSSSEHFGDCSHYCRGCRHDRTVLALTKTT